MFLKIRRKISKIIYPAHVNKTATQVLNYGSGLRMLYQKRLFDAISGLKGDIVECGVGIGNTFLIWAILLTSILN